ncbi:MAG: mannosyltransferase family protein [Solirubrobacteraceae bacterium]
METASESAEPFGDDAVALPRFDGLELAPASTTVVGQPLEDVHVRTRGRARTRTRASVVARQEVLWITVMYLAAHGLLLLVAYLNGAFGHHNFLHELANWDGLWYRELANHGYPTHVSYAQTTLGFFPLFPMAIWVVKQPLLLLTVHNSIWCSTVAGALISAVGGLIATVLVYRLAEGWWGRDVARRATILFIVFPGSVVFSMVYSEGLLMPLAAGCIYMLQRRRWLAAGVLAGFGTAVQPVGLVLPVVCAASAAVAIYRSGWRDWRSLVAPALSVTGIGAFALFLWEWTGNPLATYLAQHHGWSEKTDALALVHLTTQLAGEISFAHFNQPTINFNLVIGLIGAFVLVAELVLVWRSRREISIEAIVWTAGISFLALTSEKVPPNPRMLITAFPALLVVARYVSGPWFRVIVWLNGILFVCLSLLTFYGTTLRP